MDKHKITKFIGTFGEFWKSINEIHSSKYCVFDKPNRFLLTVIETDVSIVATDRKIMQDIFGATHTNRAEWIEEAQRLRPDLRAEIIAKYVRD